MTGSIQAGSRVRVIRDYEAPYPDPVAAEAGGRVTIDASRASEWEGWVWCTDHLGKGGWVPEAYLEVRGDQGTLLCDYDAIELTIREGETLTVHMIESAFLWVTTADGRSGWVPAEHVRPCFCQ